MKHPSSKNKKEKPFSNIRSLDSKRSDKIRDIHTHKNKPRKPSTPGESQ
jgi:hypothetical protein